MYLLCGSERAVLLDTGATDDPETFPLVDTVGKLLAPLRARHGDAYPLVVAHTHAHDDHVAGDSMFAGVPHARVIGHSLGDVKELFGIASWPEDVGSLELGGRTLDVVATPGHEPTHVMVYDPVWRVLLTGDHVYRGRLYMKDQAAFTASVARALAFCDGGRRVDALLGCHIEVDADGKEYPAGTTLQPREPPLQLQVDHLRQLAHELHARRDAPITHPLWVGSTMVVVPK